MLRKIGFQLHWLLGISAGLVLALMGVSGASLSFENEILRALNPGVMRVPPQAMPMLSPPQLLQRLGQTAPGRAVGALSVSAESGRAARVGFFADTRGAQPAPGAGGARPRLDQAFVDPYTGTLLAREDELRGHGVLHAMEDLHRRLAGGDTGKAITGASTVILLVLAASGLYLRWPRRWRAPSAWLSLRWRQRGAPFLKNLHEVVGTWLLLPYLLVALTGLWWSYEGYRDAVLALADAKPPQRAPMRKPDQAPIAPAELDTAWKTFLATTTATGGYTSASFNLPAAGEALIVNYVDADPAHERASNRLVIALPAGTVREHERYDDKTGGQKLAASMFVLHKGSFFGLAGTVAMMLASLAMPLFAVTGWMLYLKRRRVARVRAAEAVAA
jgi:sulfite reductase (NADPH) flavoprotein alpha-component